MNHYIVTVPVITADGQLGTYRRPTWARNDWQAGHGVITDAVSKGYTIDVTRETTADLD